MVRCINLPPNLHLNPRFRLKEIRLTKYRASQVNKNLESSQRIPDKEDTEPSENEQTLDTYDYRNEATIAGFVAGLTFLLDDEHRRQTLALYFASRAVTFPHFILSYHLLFLFLYAGCFRSEENAAQRNGSIYSIFCNLGVHTVSSPKHACSLIRS